MSKRFTAIIIVVVITVGLFVLSVVHFPTASPQTGENTSVITPTPIFVRNGLLGKLSFVQKQNTTVNDITKTLGTPSETQTGTEGAKVLIYNPSTMNQYKVYVLDNKAIVATDTTYKASPIFPVSLDHILFDSSSKDGNYSWHVFPEAGIGFLLNSQDDSSIMTQYFQPMIFDAYLQSVAKILNISENQPTPEAENF